LRTHIWITYLQHKYQIFANPSFLNFKRYSVQPPPLILIFLSLIYPQFQCRDLFDGRIENPSGKFAITILSLGSARPGGRGHRWRGRSHRSRG
jgi:hypothetical protein